MRTAGLFTALMAAGVAIVLVYIWSGESLAVLILSIISLFAVLLIVQWRPWRVDGDSLWPRPSTEDPDPHLDAALPDDPDRHGSGTAPVWRSRFDVTWDGRGLSAVAVGERAPQMWSWTRMDDICYDWCAAISEDDVAEERLALRLDFPDHRNPEEPLSAWLMLGPDQDPATIVANGRLAWRESKITRSRLHDLTAEERTWKLADHFGQTEIDLTEPIKSPELLYQEIRRALLASGELCRLAPDAGYDEILDTFDQLLTANGVEPLSRIEADELAAIDGSGSLPDLHWTLDWVAEQRGFRMAFIDQGGVDYLIGLVPANAADDWDGQTVGGGSTRVVLDPPR